MKNASILLAIITISCNSIFSQTINWKDYKEPDGTLKRLYIDPNLSFLHTDNDLGTETKFNIGLNATYSINKVSELSIVRSEFRPRVSYFSEGGSRVSDQNVFSAGINGSTSYRKYLTKRRGVYLESGLNANFSHIDDSNANSGTSGIAGLNLHLGIGRLEDVSTVYQGHRIARQLGADHLRSQENLFSLADQLRILDYNNTLDTRMNRVDRQAIYLESLQSLGVELNDFYQISNAIDAYTFERPNFNLSHGLEASAGLSTFYSFDNDNTTINGGANIRYGHAINEKWHGSAYGVFRTDFDDQNTYSFGGGLTYLPTARTTIRFSHDNVFIDNSLFGEQFGSRTSIAMDYFVSPNMSINASLRYSYSDRSTSFGGGTLHALSHNIGFRYFIF